MRNKNIVPFDLGKITPQAPDLEEAVLGALMLEKGAYDKISLKPCYFYKESHQKIFEAIQNLSNRNEPIDQLTVTEELKKLNWIEIIGGPYYISQLTSKISTASHIEHHAFIITDKYLAREIIKFSTDLQQRAFDELIDVQDLIDEANSEMDKINILAISDDEPVHISEATRQALKNLDERQQLYQQGKSIGIPTPNYKLTRFTGGWMDNNLIVLAARPSMGKTAYSLEIVKKAAQYGKHVCIFSLEMSTIQITDRIIIGISGIPAYDYKIGSIQPYHWDLINQRITGLLKLPILIDDKPKSIDKIKSRAKNLKRQGKCDMIVIDYLQLMESETKNKNRENEIAEISRKAKLIGQELNIPVILLSQLNREVEKRTSKRPQLSDLRESGAIEQDADIVMFLYRPEYYGLHEDTEGKPLPKGFAELIISKNRNGDLGTVEFRFNDSFTEVYDLDEINDLQNIPHPDQRIESNKDFDNTPF